MNKTGIIIENLKKNGNDLNSCIQELDETNSILSIPSKKLRKIKQLIGYVSNNVSSIEEAIEYLEPKNLALSHEVGFSATKESNVYIFTLKERLPHRITNNKYLYDRGMLQSTYLNGLNNLKMEIPLSKKRTYLYFMTHFSKDDSLIDLDNLDAKVFIDVVIQGVFTKDDSPEDVFFTQNGFVDEAIEHSFTEVFVGEYLDVEAYVLKKYKEVLER